MSKKWIIQMQVLGGRIDKLKEEIRERLSWGGSDIDSDNMDVYLDILEKVVELLKLEREKRILQIKCFRHKYKKRRCK